MIKNKISISVYGRMMLCRCTFTYVLSRGVSTDMMPLYRCTCSESAVEILSSMDHCTYVNTVQYDTVRDRVKEGNKCKDFKMR